MLFIVSLLSDADEPKGIIGETYEDGSPVIWKFVNEMPSASIREQLTWLTVISWKYDGTTNNGMPLQSENQSMIKLEDAIEDGIEFEDILQHAYSRTGNNLKELVYYIHNRDQFLEAFNKALENHARYPIEIDFYEDQAWEDFQNLLHSFKLHG